MEEWFCQPFLYNQTTQTTKERLETYENYDY